MRAGFVRARGEGVFILGNVITLVSGSLSTIKLWKNDVEENLDAS